MGMFSRAHSGNLTSLRNAINNWQSTDYRAEVRTWMDHERYQFRLVAVVRNPDTGEELIRKDFTDYPNIRDEDVQTVVIATWFNKQFNDYTGRFL